MAQTDGDAVLVSAHVQGGKLMEHRRLKLKMEGEAHRLAILETTIVVVGDGGGGLVLPRSVAE